MKLRRSWMSVVIACVGGAALAGCETLRPHPLRTGRDSPPPGSVAGSRGDDAGSDPAEDLLKRGKSGRRSGGLSSDAREIEDHLGVPSR